MIKKYTHDELQNRVTYLEGQLIEQKRFRDINNVLFQISKALNNTANLDELYKRIHKLLSSIIDTTNFYISIYDNATDTAVFPYCVDTVDDCYPPSLGINTTESSTAEVIRTGLPLMTTKKTTLKRRSLSKKKIPPCTLAECWLGVPLKTRTGVIGVMAVQSYTDKKRYDQTDMEVMLSVADQIAITIELKHIEQGLRLSEGKIQSIFRAAPIGIGLVINRVLMTVNNRLCEIVGYTVDELIGQDARMLYFTDEEYEYVGKVKYQQIEAKGTGSVETRYKHKNGKSIDVSLCSTPLDPGDLSVGVTFTVADITKRKQASFKLQENEQRFRQLFDNMSSGVAIYESLDNGQSFIFKDLNRAGLKSGQTTKEEIIGREVRDVFPGIKEIGLFDVFKSVWKTGNPEHYPSNMYKDDKILLWIENYVCKLPSGELVAIYEDTTAQKEIEESKIKLEKQIQQSQKMESIGTLAGGIAHDFNNILFPILGHTEMLMDDVDDDNPHFNHINEIYISALRAKDLVKQILTFSRQEEKELKLIQIQPIIKEALKLIRSTIPTTIDIKQYLKNDCGVIKADPTQIHQIIMNLTTNAYHAMEKAGGEMRVSLKEVQLNKSDLITPELTSGVYILLTVSDTGIGMSDDKATKIFDPFFTTKDQGKGTGMGLSVVHGIVHGMGGAIKVFSEPGTGTEFKVYLPVVKDLQGKQKKIESIKAIQGGTEQILLVDDEEKIVLMEKLMLERLGYKVTSRTSSVDALEVFRANPEIFDLVITDMAMPNMSGDKFAVELTKIRPDIPILLCTGFSETVSEKEAASLGIKGFLLKPIIMKELARKVRETIGLTIEEKGSQE